MIHFINIQFDDFKEDGWSFVSRKLKRLLFLPFDLLLIVIAFPLFLLIRLLRPLVIVRIFSVNIGRIGGIYQGEWYLSEKAAGLHCGRYFDFFYFDKETSHVNLQWKRMWKRALPYMPGIDLWKKILTINRLIPGYEKHDRTGFQHCFPDLKIWQAHQKNPLDGKLDVINKRLELVLKNKKPNISMSLEEERACTVLDDLGIDKEKQYICFHARDSAYLNKIHKKIDWSYHDYRDSSIQNYVPMAEEMANRGYYAIRVGAVVKDQIHSSNPKVIDYAISKSRTDFNDIYLGSHCRFMVCSDGGISVIPEMLRIPAVYVNWTLLLRISTWVLNGLFIFKKFYLKNENRFMMFSEMLELDFGDKDTNRIFADLKLELVENTPEEIQAVTIEMDERLNGKWETTKDDEELQKHFWDLFGPDKLRSPDLRIGTEYLRENKNLLVYTPN